MIITKIELLAMSTEQIAKLTKGKHLKIVLNNGEIRNEFIENLLGASYPSNQFCGFITSDGHTTYLQVIDYIELI